MIKSILRTLAGNAPLVLITLLVVISLYKFLKTVWNNFFAPKSDSKWEEAVHRWAIFNYFVNSYIDSYAASRGTVPERGGACAASDVKPASMSMPSGHRAASDAERVYELNEDGVYDITL